MLDHGSTPRTRDHRHRGLLPRSRQGGAPLCLRWCSA